MISDWSKLHSIYVLVTDHRSTCRVLLTYLDINALLNQRKISPVLFLNKLRISVNDLLVKGHFVEYQIRLVFDEFFLTISNCNEFSNSFVGSEMHRDNSYKKTELQMICESLSPRKKQVLRLIAQGHTLKEMCKILGIKSSTIKTHRNELYAVLGISNRAELFLMRNHFPEITG